LSERQWQIAVARRMLNGREIRLQQLRRVAEKTQDLRLSARQLLSQLRCEGLPWRGNLELAAIYPDNNIQRSQMRQKIGRPHERAHPANPVVEVR
jgi:hypothetical protein